jgi:hypothetical protein
MIMTMILTNDKYRELPGTPIELGWPMLPRLVLQIGPLEPLE